jgi:hypothetical protein
LRNFEHEGRPSRELAREVHPNRAGGAGMPAANQTVPMALDLVLTAGRFRPILAK